MLDTKLSECFDIEAVKTELNEIKSHLDDDVNNPNKILRSNISRAERLLDKIENEWEVGTTNATIKLVEIAAKLIECITSAANSMLANDVSLETTNQKQEFLDLKKLEFELKKNKGEKSLPAGDNNTYNTQNNIILTSREDILKLMK